MECAGGSRTVERSGRSGSTRVRVTVRGAWALGVCLFLTASGASARTWHVPSEAPTIQAGIDSAQAGDEVLVAPGTYTWTLEGSTGSAMLTLKPGVSLRGEGGAQATILDAEGIGRVIVCADVGTQVRIEDLTIQNGLASPPSPENARGGGIYVTGASEPTIVRCVFRDNRAFGYDGVSGLGGAIHCGVATIEDCEFIDNQAGTPSTGGYGGAILCGAAWIERCYFEGNVVAGDFSAEGGAIRSHGAHIIDSVFEENLAGALRIAGGGAVIDYGAATITSCTFRLNEARARVAAGGAVHTWDPGGTISRSVFLHNVARGSGSGGAIRATGAATFITECVFLGNTARGENPLVPGEGGALYASLGAAVENCTLIGNSGGTADGTGGIWQPSGTVHATIIAGSVGNACGGSPGPTWTCSDLYGNGSNAICGTDGGGNFSADPQFCAVDLVGTGNVTIQADSPCAPGNHPDGAGCGVIGAAPVGCGSVSVHKSTWTATKLLYR